MRNNGNSLSEAKSGWLVPLLEARPASADVRLPDTASGERSASRRRATAAKLLGASAAASAISPFG